MQDLQRVLLSTKTRCSINIHRHFAKKEYRKACIKRSFLTLAKTFPTNRYLLEQQHRSRIAHSRNSPHPVVLTNFNSLYAHMPMKLHQLISCILPQMKYFPSLHQQCYCGTTQTRLLSNGKLSLCFHCGSNKIISRAQTVANLHWYVRICCLLYFTRY